MRIYIDAGHGGESTGAVYNGRREQDDTLRLALAVKKILLGAENVEVMLSREDNTNPSLEKRAEEANLWGADYFCSIHRNAFSPNKAKGIEAWCYSGIEKGGITYTHAENIVNAVSKASGFVNRGVKLGAPSYADFAVNRLTKMSSCLLEAGFIDSDEDNNIFDGKFDSIAKALASELLRAVGINPVIKGDIDGDGKLTASDARSVLRASVELEKVDIEKADMNGDGKITAADAREILRKSVEGEG